MSQEKQEDCGCKCCLKKQQKRQPRRHAKLRNHHHHSSKRSNFINGMNLTGTNYDLITSVEYLNKKYGLRKSHYIEKFINCIHKKINIDIEKISDSYIDSLSPWVKIKLFLLLVMLSQRGGPEYWLEKNDQEKVDKQDKPEKQDKVEELEKFEDIEAPEETIKTGIPPLDSSHMLTLTEQIMRQNIKQDFTELKYDENYVFSSIWANFMEGLINHYLEKIIIPHSEMRVCQQLYKPMMKIISLYNEYNELMEKSERNGFLSPFEPSLEQSASPLSQSSSSSSTLTSNHNEDPLTKERLQRAQKLLWQARQDIPKTISKELTLLSEMYSTLSADEQDYALDEFVCCAEEYIELEFLPGLIELLFANCGKRQFWKIMIVLEPFFYYIEDVGEDGDSVNDEDNSHFKTDARVITLEKICEVAARQKWI